MPVRRHSRISARRRRKKLIFFAAAALLLLCAFLLLLRLLRKPSKPIPTPPYVVAIDAGHGGSDPGAVGLFRETDMAEATAVYLEYLLAQDANYIPVLCRAPGESRTIAERAQTALEANAVLLLSIHANSADNPEAAGFECYPTLPSRYWGPESLAFARCLAARMQASGALLRGENGVRYAWYVENGRGGYDKKIAEESGSIPSRYRGFGILEDCGCPAVLAEQCFVTSAEDAAFWGTDAGYRTAAQAYYYAVCDYFGTEPIAF
ncbi:MAG: N-acetylmuramoyl-L-alanine amidase [Oscillospiraceae bacterium]|nr:N-acetylmuramoyl-L-alanine amidase [Oscillospiraceae bacterium]